MDTEKKNRIWDTYVNQEPKEFIENGHIHYEEDLRLAIDKYLSDLPRIFGDPSLTYDHNAPLMGDISAAMWETLSRLVE